MALNSVGTPGIMTGRSLLISFKVGISSNFRSRMISSPWPAEIHHRGHGKDVEQRQHADDAVARLGDSVLPSLHLVDIGREIGMGSIAPLGVPVVPPVYCSTAIASGVIHGRT